MGNQINSWQMAQNEDTPMYRFNKEDDNFILFHADTYKYGNPFTVNYKVGMLLVDLTDKSTGNVYRQEDFAAICGITRQAVMKYLRGEEKAGRRVYSVIPLTVLFNLSQHFHIPLCYFTDNSIPYTENPTEITPPYKYFHTFPLTLKHSNDRGCSYFEDLRQLKQSAEKKAATQTIKEINESTGLVPEIISVLSEQSIEQLKELIKNAVVEIYGKQMEQGWENYIHSSDYIQDIIDSGEYVEVPIE